MLAWPLALVTLRPPLKAEVVASAIVPPVLSVATIDWPTKLAAVSVSPVKVMLSPLAKPPIVPPKPVSAVSLVKSIASVPLPRLMSWPAATVPPNAKVPVPVSATVPAPVTDPPIVAVPGAVLNVALIMPVFVTAARSSVPSVTAMTPAFVRIVFLSLSATYVPPEEMSMIPVLSRLAMT